MARTFVVIASINGQAFDLATDNEDVARTTAQALSHTYGHPRVEVWHGASCLGAYRGGERTPCPRETGFAIAPIRSDAPVHC